MRDAANAYARRAFTLCNTPCACTETDAHTLCIPTRVYTVIPTCEQREHRSSGVWRGGSHLSCSGILPQRGYRGAPAAGSVPLSAIRVGAATRHTPLPRLFLRPTFGEQLLSAQWRELFGGLCGFCWRFGGDVLPAGHSRNLRCCGFLSGGRPVFNNGVFPVYAHFCGVTVGVTGFP